LPTLHVLVVDDEPGLRMAAERMLRDWTVRVPGLDVEVDFSIEAAETGEEALERMAVSRPDIVLLDQLLPGISGLDVLEKIQGQQSLGDDMLTIMVTAYASVDMAVAATKRGVFDFLAKPVTSRDLQAAIGKAANRLLLARQARRLAEENRQVRFQFIRVLGHELKAPLNAVRGYLEMLAAKTLGPQVDAYQQAIERSMIRIDGMHKLIADLLDMTRIEAGTRVRQLVPLDMRQMAAEAIELASMSAREMGVVIELHANAEQTGVAGINGGAGGELTMLADRSEIEMMLNNLISNAVKYNRPQGRVNVTLSRQGDELIIEVADTGIGMTTTDIEHLFGEFVRIKNEKTRQILGSGLGLSIVKKLAELYGGSVTVQSEPDVGSTFTVRIKCSRT